MFPRLHRLALGFSMAATGIFAHGLIQDPPSRSWICGAETKPHEIEHGTPKTPACATAFEVDPLAPYNFMAVLTHTLGRAEVTPLPKNVCSFDSEIWKGATTPWDVPMDWPANPMSAGEQIFTWNISWGPHFDDTQDFSYWITKPGFVFSPTKALTWDDFEAEPFCRLEYDGKNPGSNPNIVEDKAGSLFMTRCQVPERSGHHVIYAEWGRIPPTIERFHGCVDAQFGGVTGILRPPSGYAAVPLYGVSGERRDLLGRVRTPGNRVLTLEGLRVLTPENLQGSGNPNRLSR